MSKSMKSEKQALVPRLRFPEFRDAGEWQVRTLGEKGVASFVKKRVSLNRLNLESYVSTENLLPEFGGKRRASKLPPSGSFTSFSPADILLANIRPYLKKVWVADSHGAASNDVIVIRPMDGICGSFLSALLRNDAFIDYVMEGAKGVKMPRGDVSLIKEYPLAVPGPEEQQKIADCLSSLDDLIAAQADKIDALKSHKKGLMQQLFPREGETVPRLRFPEFRGVGEWRKCKLEEMARRGSGHTPNKKNPSYYNGGIKWVSLADSDKLDNGYIFKTKHEISKEGLKNSSAVLHPAGTVVLSRDAGVGKSAVLYSPMAVSQHFIAWRCNESELNNWFFYYLLQKLKPDLESIAVGNTIKTIGLSYFKSMEIMAPSLNEQEAIAYCLSSLEALVAASTEKLDALKTHKKGLMQQLFPNPEAIGV